MVLGGELEQQRCPKRQQGQGPPWHCQPPVPEQATDHVLVHEVPQMEHHLRVTTLRCSFICRWDCGKDVTEGHFIASLLTEPSSTCFWGWTSPRREAQCFSQSTASHCMLQAAIDVRCGSHLAHKTVDKST